jgi:hypothetical protein
MTGRPGPRTLVRPRLRPDRTWRPPSASLAHLGGPPLPRPRPGGACCAPARARSTFLLQILLLAAMGAFIPRAAGARGAAFAVTAAVLFAVLAVLWLLAVKESWLNGAPEVQDVLIAFAGWMAGRESARRSERIKAGLERRKAEGLPVGRQQGATDTGRRRRAGYVASWESGQRRAAGATPTGVTARPRCSTAASAGLSWSAGGTRRRAGSLMSGSRMSATARAAASAGSRSGRAGEMPALLKATSTDP